MDYQDKAFADQVSRYQRDKAAFQQAADQARAERDQYAARVQKALESGNISTTTAVEELKRQRAERLAAEREKALEAFCAVPLLTADQVSEKWGEIKAFYAARCAQCKGAVEGHLQAALRELESVKDIRQEAMSAARRFKTDCAVTGTDASGYDEAALARYLFPYSDGAAGELQRLLNDLSRM